MTRLFIDTEFNGYRGELISMALVAVTGEEWYAVLPCHTPVEWVAEHVMPILGNAPVSKKEMQDSLTVFLDKFSSVHIIADWPEDIHHFCELLITGPGQRIDTPPLTLEILRIEGVSALPHNALADARALRACYFGD